MQAATRLAGRATGRREVVRVDRKWWTLIAVCAGTFMLLLDVTIVVVAAPEIESSLHASFGEVQWVLDAYLLALASLLLSTGVLSDRYGRRRLLAIGLAIFTLGSLLCGLATSPAMLIASRAGQGVGGAIMFATSVALLGHSFRGKDRGVAFAVWGAIYGLGVALGPLLGGAITSGISWRGIFFVNVPIGVAALIVTFWRVEESRAPHFQRLDLAGFVLLTCGLVGVIYGLIRAGETSFGTAEVIASLAAGAVLLAAFVAVEAKIAHPLFDLGLLRIPTFVGGSIAAFAMNASLFAMFLYLILYLQDILGYSALGAGLRLLIISAAILIAATIAGRLSEHVPVRWLIGPGLILVGAGLLVMSGLDPASTWTHLIAGFVISGIGAGLVNPPLASTAIGVVAPERGGMANGINLTFRNIGVAAAIAAYGSILVTALHTNLAHALSATPSLASRTSQIATSVRQDDIAAAIHTAPASLQGQLAAAIRSSYVHDINDLLVVSGVVALVGGAASLALIRTKDFVARTHPTPAQHPEPASSPTRP